MPWNDSKDDLKFIHSTYNIFLTDPEKKITLLADLINIHYKLIL